uniref:Uncharacterized protein n=1 Tax=Globisporangium ultimum (strain ATCC 200006 / CBS 805.95 / DAOM BR144) TaxID=431595 RepID=K3WH11_GLOUD
MSFYLPRIALNRFYVSLIVLSCWSTPLIVHLYKRDEAKKRLICLICDCALDLVAAVVIPCVIIATYVKDFDMELQGFPMEFWYDDIWNMHAIHEFQILLVASWNDLATRMVFSVGMLIAMSDIKDLLRARANAVSVPPASTPMGEIQPVCALVLINCYEFAINGAKEDIDAQWSRLNPEMVVEAVIRHCPVLEMPSIIQQFSHMLILKVYNTSITEWSADSALTGTYHPNLASLYLIRVNMTDGMLPPGLLSPEFPSTLADIEMSTTNLRMLPDDLDTKWPTDGALMFEYSEFTSIPAVVMRLRPFLLSFCGNPIEEIPSELFAVESMYYLHIGDNQKLKALPANATLSGALGQFYLERTQITFFPSWLDPLVDFAVKEGFQTFRAVGTPYCEYATSVFNDSLSNADAMVAVRAKTKTPAMLGPGKPSILMDTSESTRPIIYRAVVCGVGTEWTFFPLSTEDRQSTLR